jgi:hypothetical protein
VDPSEAVAAAIASAHICGACSQSLPDNELRDFGGVPVCVDCYRELGLLTLGELPVDPDERLLALLLSSPGGDVAPGAVRRYGLVERFASRINPAGAERLVVSAARGGTASGLQEVLWILIAVDALLRAGGRNGSRELEGRELSLLLNLSARVGMDVAWAAMLEIGVAKRALDALGEEWVYEDLVRPGGESLPHLSDEKEAFANYIRGLKAKVDLLVKDATGKRDEVDIPLAIIARTADEILAAFSIMEQPRKGSRKPAS